MNDKPFRSGSPPVTVQEPSEISQAHSTPSAVSPDPSQSVDSTTAGTSKARRSGRVSKEIPILLFGSDVDGCIFTEETRTVVLSRHGAGIVSRYRLIPEQELVLRWKDAAREAEIRVVGEVAQQGAFHTYGVAFLNDKLNFWQMEFPPANELHPRPPLLLLGCAACGDTVELLNGDFEYDICAIHGGLTRFCQHCGMLTVWKQPQDAIPTLRPPKTVSAAPPLQPPVTPPAPLPPSTPAAEIRGLVLTPLADSTASEQERRNRPRAKVNFFACVRSAAFPEEVVRCIDMAKGGVSFKTPNPYELGTLIQIAVPYAAEERQAPAYFVKGRIVNVRRLEIEGMVRCGVEFLR